MNVRIVTHVSYEGGIEGLQEIVSDFAQALCDRGYYNDIEAESAMKSLILVRENTEIADGEGLEEFWAEQRDGAVLVAIPALSRDYDVPSETIYEKEEEEVG